MKDKSMSKPEITVEYMQFDVRYKFGLHALRVGNIQFASGPKGKMNALKKLMDDGEVYIYEREHLHRTECNTDRTKPIGSAGCVCSLVNKNVEIAHMYVLKKHGDDTYWHWNGGVGGSWIESKEEASRYSSNYVAQVPNPSGGTWVRV